MVVFCRRKKNESEQQNVRKRNYFAGHVGRKTRTGIDGILFAAPIADLVALVVVLGLTFSLFQG